jgi:hypothetical protein
MIYRLLADVVLVLHAGFVVFVILGAFLVLRWPRIAWIHVPVALWGAGIEFFGGLCPLTPLENHLRHLGGELGYPGGFIDHYVGGAIYPDGLTRETQWVIAGVMLAINAGLYGLMIARVRRSVSRGGG